MAESDNAKTGMGERRAAGPDGLGTNTMRVEELIEALKALPPTAVVVGLIEDTEVTIDTLVYDHGEVSIRLCPLSPTGFAC